MQCILVFVHDWTEGGQYNRRSLNKRRKIETSDGEVYYEFNVGNKGDIAKCSAKDILLLDTYRWNIAQSTSGSYVRTSVRQNGKIVKLYFSRLVLRNPEGNVTYLNSDTLDNRRENLSIRVQKPNLSDASLARVPGINKKEVREAIKPGLNGNWQGGRYGGSLCRVESRSCWQIAFQNPPLRKYFFDNKYRSKSRAKTTAEMFRKEEAEKRGLVFNRHQVIVAPDGDSYLKVEGLHKRKVMYFYVDVEDIDVVKRYKWAISQRSHSADNIYEVVSYGIEKKRLHKMLTDYDITDHIDGNPLNNRRCNLRDGSLINTKNHPLRSDNNSGMTGISFNKSKNAWIVQWSVDGKRKSKSFSVIEGKRTKEQAKELAINHRKGIDEWLQIHQQQYLE